jgi:hypothetical protein
MMNSSKRVRAQGAVLILSLIGIGFATAAFALEWDGKASLGLGYDDNIYREADPDMDEGRYLPYDLEIGLEQSLPADFLSRIEIGGKGKWFTAPNSDGARSLMELRLNLERTFQIYMPGQRSSRLSMNLFGVTGDKNRTYYARSVGEEFAVDVGDSIVTLGDRYDSRFTRAGASADWRLPGKIRFKSKFLFTRRDYKKDYGEFADIESIDYDAWRWNLLLRKEFGRRWRFDLEAARGRAEYEEWTARDFDGNKVAGETQNFDYRTWQASTRFRPSRRGWIQIQIESKTRRDPFLGYYDFDQTAIRPQLRLYLPHKTKLTLEYEYAHREYARARIGFNPVKELREDFDRLFILRAEHELEQWLDVIFQLSYRDTDEANPNYTYTRSRIWVGIEAHH